MGGSDKEEFEKERGKGLVRDELVWKPISESHTTHVKWMLNR